MAILLVCFGSRKSLTFMTFFTGAGRLPVAIIPDAKDIEDTVNYSVFRTNLRKKYSTIWSQEEIILVLLSGCNAWEGLEKDTNLLMTLCSDLVTDLARKGQTVWFYRRLYAQYVSFAIGERVYLIRARFAAQLREYLRNQLRSKTLTVKLMVQNALLLQKRTQGIYLLSNEFEHITRTIQNIDNPYNGTRFGEQNCHVAGTPCDIMPIREGYRRNLGAMDEALKLIEARRKFIEKTYYPKKKPPVNIAEEVNRSLSFKYTSSRSESRDVKTDFFDLAPDFMNL